ncbi:MAG TPA: alpha/beta fold hydrolase [Solirubrobacteraceae bacterium]|jgi:pimeloyl-ACP methyl ester carboxylesterase|nr:alpha/beta fold hydrolase [Solirubrobacteraceae bacterium]
MRRALRTLEAALVVGAVCVVPSAPAHADQIAWKPCGDTNSLACGHLTVPLDPSGATPGTITLAMRRHRAPVGESKDAVIALAGGPGQSAIPFIGQFGQILGSIASTRDVIAFDQRGTGLSHPLSCPAFEHLKGAGSPQAVAICAGQIGQTRGLYTTADTVADIEAIRQAGGYEKLVLYGTSYGTKVAERYAQAYPGHVEALVLDSVVPPSGPEPFDVTSFQAVGRVLRQLCGQGACAHITRDSVGDLARLVRRMGHSGVSARTIDGQGKAGTTHISSNDLIAVLIAGDLNPILRAEFPAAVHAAAGGDPALLARLVGRAEDASEGGEENLSEGFDSPLYYSTICDETDFPWKRTGSARAHLLEALAALRAAPAKTFAPFTPANALALSDVPVCADWPNTAGGPEVDDAPLPNVPTLILSGADDLRTPTADAREVAAEIPDAQLLVVPNTGHSVLGSDLTSCSQNALKALFAGKQIKQCRQQRPPQPLLPTPLAPRDLGNVAPARGTHGRVGRTLAAALLTLEDFKRESTLAALEQAGSLLEGLSTVSVGGLRAGWGSLGNGGVTLHGYAYVPGVTLSGKSSASGSMTLRIGGRAAAHGTLRVNAHGALSGALAGQHVHATAQLARR